MCIIQTTLPGDWIEPMVGEWSSSLIQDGNAACVQRSKITSVYEWDGSLESSEEWRIQIKTHPQKLEALIHSIMAAHPYEIPEITSWIAETTSDYASWVEG